MGFTPHTILTVVLKISSLLIKYYKMIVGQCEKTMKKAFCLDGAGFFEVDTNAGKSLLSHLDQTYGSYIIPKSVWQKDLSVLPSPLRVSDCVGVWASGSIPISTASMGDTTLDVIRKEKNPIKRTRMTMTMVMVLVFLT